MNTQPNHKPGIVRHLLRTSRRAAACFATVGALILAHPAGAQTTNALDEAIDPVYVGLGAPNGLGTGGQNGGFGFQPWTFNLTGNGGSFINDAGPSGRSFNLWNTSPNNYTIAVRPFTTPLSAGQSFSVQLRLNSLDSNLTTNMLALQDADGNILFAYWHVGNEPNGAVNGSYRDGLTNNGVATNFTYAYQQFKKFTFTLNSATEYTFADSGTGASFTGAISNAQIARVAFIRYNGNFSPPNGQDFQFDQLMITSSSGPTFQAASPAPGSLSAPIDTPISVQVLAGSVLLNTSVVSMSVDGVSVTPVVSGSGSVMNVSYTPASPFSYASAHTVQVIVEDSNNTPYTNSWSFKTGYEALPVVLPGPIGVSNGNDLVIFSAAGEGWLGTNYNASSSRTLYVRHSMAFLNTADEPGNGGGGCYGGVHFFSGNQERLLVGETWMRTTWSVDTKLGGGLDGEPELNPSTLVIPGEWHTMVTRVDYTPGGNATATIWLDPDFSLTEAEQPVPPLVVSINNTFDNIRLRCGNAPSSAEFTNIVVAATSSGVGFVAPAAPQFQGFVPGMNAVNVSPATPIGAEVIFGSYGIGTNEVVLRLDGNVVNPNFVVGNNSIVVNYQPATPLEPGSFHNVELSVTDSNATPYSVNWFFTVDQYPALPVVLLESTNGTVDVFGGGPGTTIWTGQNGWIGNNFGSSSSATLYTRFSVNFLDLNAESGSGGGFGGLHFFRGNTEVLIVGNNWGSVNWSLDHLDLTPDLDLVPVTPIVLSEWHTIVVKTEFVPDAADNVTIWLDPDFTKAENNQPNAPLTFSADNSFDNIHLRAGNGSAYAQFTNIVMAATAPEVGFADVAPPAHLSILPAGANVNVSWTGSGTLQEAPALTGPWTDSVDQSNPQIRPATNSALFFRIEQ